MSEEKRVAASALDLLNLEMVNYFSRQIIANAREIDEPANRVRLKKILYKMGEDVGIRLVEKLPRDRKERRQGLDGSFDSEYAESKVCVTDIDRIKFICKDFWQITTPSRKSMDKLRSDRSGTWHLIVKEFAPISHFSGMTSAADAAMLEPYVWMTCGMIQGALNNLGLATSVTGEVMWPGCTFHVKDLDKGKYDTKPPPPAKVAPKPNNA